MKSLRILVIAALCSCGSLLQSQTVDGSEAGLAYFSAQQPLIYTGSGVSGVYWFDEQQGLGSPFQSYADQTTDGGGWTVGVVSLDAAPVAIDISSNTGTVGAPFTSSFTRDVEYLGQDQLAQVFYELRVAGTSTIVFQGHYTGSFSDIDPVFTTTLSGSAPVGLDASFDFHGANNYDVLIMFREQEILPELREVPEPSAYALIAGFCALGWIAVRRRGIQR